MEDGIQAVDVISLCTANGSIQPLQLRLENSDKQLIRVDIRQITRTRDVSVTGAEARIFTCRGQMGSLECTLELKYHIRSHTWILMNNLY